MPSNRANWREATAADIKCELSWRTDNFEEAWRQDAKPRANRTGNPDVRVPRRSRPIDEGQSAQGRVPRRRIGGTPERRRFLAGAAVQNAVRAGLMRKSPECEHAGCSKAKVEACHADLADPFCVIWLCRPHRYRLGNDPEYTPTKGYKM
jgi:hypothetical protein